MGRMVGAKRTDIVETLFGIREASAGVVRVRGKEVRNTSSVKAIRNGFALVTEEAVDVRIVSATHQNLAQCVTQGRFRQDLFYRLNVIELRMPRRMARSP